MPCNPAGSQPWKVCLWSASSISLLSTTPATCLEKAFPSVLPAASISQLVLRCRMDWKLGGPEARSQHHLSNLTSAEPSRLQNHPQFWVPGDKAQIFFCKTERLLQLASWSQMSQAPGKYCIRGNWAGARWWMAAGAWSQCQGSLRNSWDYRKMANTCIFTGSCFSASVITEMQE